ncbi:hypothetical protein [Cutibacterium namnetense]|uniref:hypothetical protein n=1 Tax=Cutibacterium namnetense TaxID=1574624 RepID=UPI001290881F|nr:hypothetical protein [Cutibacterium namnetense]
MLSIAVLDVFGKRLPQKVRSMVEWGTNLSIAPSTTVRYGTDWIDHGKPWQVLETIDASGVEI